MSSAETLLSRSFQMRAIQQEMMNIYDRGEDQKAGREIKVKKIADEPRTRG